ncbi:MAG TPA: hypothetical protein PK736_01320 [Bacteroidia bacterium]|nr:hypothetical protein [Bacteroidota bacterium]HRC32062.1 hypothetical protein [Bacteroidia bacterium]
MEKYKNLIFVFAFAFAGGWQCGDTKEATKSSVPAETKIAPNIETVAAGYMNAKVVDLTGLDGCKFVLELEGGKQLVPTNLKPEFCRADIEVSVKYFVPKGAVNTCMAGTIIEITDIKIRERRK